MSLLFLQESEKVKSARDSLVGEICIFCLDTMRGPDNPFTKGDGARWRARIEKAFDEYDNTIGIQKRSIEKRLSNLENILKKDFNRWCVRMRRLQVAHTKT